MEITTKFSQIKNGEYEIIMDKAELELMAIIYTYFIDNTASLPQNNSMILGRATALHAFNRISEVLKWPGLL